MEIIVDKRLLVLYSATIESEGSIMATKKAANSIISLKAVKDKLYDATREHDANVIGEKIQAAREANGLTLAAFSELLSKYGVAIGRQAINKWETGNSVPNAYQLVAICHALGLEDGIAYFTREPKKESLLNEAGWRRLAEYKADLIATGRYTPAEPTLKTRIKYITMKISTLPASAGTGEFLGDDSFEDVRFPEAIVPDNADFGIRVNGDSMEPAYHDSQIVWVQRCETLNPGEVGIFEYDGGGYLKAYEEQEPDEDEREYFISSDGVLRMQPVLVSYNEKYSPILVSPHAFFRIAGRVLN